MDANSEFQLVWAISSEQIFFTKLSSTCRLSATLFLQMTPSMHCLVEILQDWQPCPFPHFVGSRSGPRALADRELLSILGEEEYVFCQHQPGAPDWLLRGLALPICISLVPPAQSMLSYPEHSKYLWSRIKNHLPTACGDLRVQIFYR